MQTIIEWIPFDKEHLSFFIKEIQDYPCEDSDLASGYSNDIMICYYDPRRKKVLITSGFFAYPYNSDLDLDIDELFSECSEGFRFDSDWQTGYETILAWAKTPKIVLPESFKDKIGGNEND